MRGRVTVTFHRKIPRALELTVAFSYIVPAMEFAVNYPASAGINDSYSQEIANVVGVLSFDAVTGERIAQC